MEDVTKDINVIVNDLENVEVVAPWLPQVFTPI